MGVASHRQLLIALALATASGACELSVYTPDVTTVGDPGSGDSQSGDHLTGDQQPGDPAPGDPASGDPAASLANGSFCTDGNQCQSTICIDDVCCAEACDGTCEECNGSGVCVLSEDDAACGTVDCDGLDSTCRDFDDPAARCASRGVCKLSNTSDCTDYLDASNVTPCNDNDPGTAPDLCNGSGSCVGAPTVLAKVGSFNIGDGATNPVGTVVSITGVGFQPKVLFLWWSGRTADATTVTTSNGRQHYRRGFAFTTGPGQSRMVTNQAEDSSVTADADRMYREDVLISSLTRSRVIDGMAELVSFDADGFSVQIVFDPFEVNLAITYLALGGSSVTDAAVGTFTSIIGVPNGTQDITGVGFQPDVVFFLSGYGTTAPPFMEGSASMSIGAATGPAVEENAVMVVSVPNGSNPPTSRGYGLLGEAAVTGSSWLTLTERGKLGAFLPDGFQMDWVEADPDDEFVYFYLALKGGGPHLGSLLTELDLTTDIVVNGLGYRPAGALLFSRGDNEDVADNPSSRDYWSVGTFAQTAAEQWVQGTHHGALSAGDPMPTSRAAALLSSESVYVRLSDGGGTSGLMTLLSIDDDGFTCRMTDADSSPQRFVWFVTFGPGPP